MLPRAPAQRLPRARCWGHWLHGSTTDRVTPRVPIVDRKAWRWLGERSPEPWPASPWARCCVPAPGCPVGSSCPPTSSDFQSSRYAAWGFVPQTSPFRWPTASSSFHWSSFATPVWNFVKNLLPNFNWGSYGRRILGSVVLVFLHKEHVCTEEPFGLAQLLHFL